MSARKSTVLGSLLFALTFEATAASGEMGMGVPNFGQFGDPVGGIVVVWSLSNAVIPFPPGCSFLIVNKATMGSDPFKVSVATMLTAKVTARSVRFYAHADRDGGCGVDYVQLMD